MKIGGGRRIVSRNAKTVSLRPKARPAKVGRTVVSAGPFVSPDEAARIQKKGETP